MDIFFVSTVIIKRCTFELETLAIFLSGIGLTLISYANPDDAFLQLAAIAIGMILFCFIIWFIKNPDFICKIRFLIVIFAILLFVFNLVFAKEINGAKNWIKLGAFSIQPSEFIKIAFILWARQLWTNYKPPKFDRIYCIFCHMYRLPFSHERFWYRLCIFRNIFSYLFYAFRKPSYFNFVVLHCHSWGIFNFNIQAVHKRPFCCLGPRLGTHERTGISANESFDI